MNIEDFFEICQAISEDVTSDLPFSESALVFRIENKIFAMVNLDDFEKGINLKCYRHHQPSDLIKHFWSFLLTIK